MDGEAEGDALAAIRPARSSRATLGFAQTPFAPAAHALLLAGAAGAVFLAAGVPQGAAGVFLVCAGAALVLCPPGVKVDGSLWLAAAAMVLCAGLAFLPAHWFPVPGWRKALENVPVVPLPGTITPAPWQTAFWLALLAGTALIVLFLLAQPVRSGTLLSLALAAALICGAYAGLAIYARTTGWHYPFDAGATFGFFPNRNHTATFLVTGSILAIGILGVTLRDGRWIASGLAAAGLTTCVTGLFFFSASRGGVVFLLVGALLWILGLGNAHRSGRLLVTCVALLLAGGTLFLLSGSTAQTRIAAIFRPAHPVPEPRVLPPLDGAGSTGQALPVAGDTPMDERVLIYEDTLPLIRSFPLTGTGLGTFAMIFPQYRNASLSATPAIHPESDWLMFAAEAGLPALVCFLALLWLLGRRLPALMAHPYWPLRWGCVAAAAAAMLHGLVDVPAHHVSLGWWILVLAGLGLQPGRVKAQAAQRSRTQHVVFVLGGIAILVLGVRLIRAEWFGGAPLPPFVVERIEPDIVRAYAHHDIEGAARLTRQAIFASPMAEAMYYQSGAFELPFADSDAQVDAAFQAERLLEPNSPATPLRQGDAWIHYNSARPVGLWLDALARQQRIDRAAGAGPAAGARFYGDLLARAAKWPDVQRGLMAAIDDRPAFVLAGLENARPELVEEQLQRFSRDEGFLQRLDANEQRRFLLAWYAAGDRPELARFIAGQPGWQQAAWPIRLRQWVDARQFERAVREAAAHYEISLALPGPGQDGSSGEAPENEAVDPVTAFNAYWREGNTVAALRILNAAADGAPPVPPEVWRLKAASAAQAADWAAAWQDLQRYIRAKHGDREL